MSDHQSFFGNYVAGEEGTQRRLLGRVPALRTFAYPDYKTSSKPDRVCIVVNLKRGLKSHKGTSSDIVNRVLHKETGLSCSVVATTGDIELRRSWLEFRINFQDPAMSHIQVCVNALEKVFGLSKPPVIFDMEIAIDFFPKKGGDLNKLRLDMVETLYRNFLPPDEYGDVNPRCYLEGLDKTVTVYIKGGHGSTIKCPIGSTRYFGHKKAPVYWKIYHKELDGVTHDDESNAKAELPESEKSARIEVTFNEDGLNRILGISSMEELSEFMFTDIKRLFPFKIPTVHNWVETVDVIPIIRAGNEWRARWILSTEYEKQGAWYIRSNNNIRNDRKYVPMVSDKPLNKMVSEAIRDLARKFHK